MKETLHSDFETIERENQNYRISTRVTYRTSMNDYICKAHLYKSYGGRVRDTSRHRIHSSKNIVSDETEIEDALEECVDSCKETLDTFEEAKNVSIDVNINDT